MKIAIIILLVLLFILYILYNDLILSVSKYNIKSPKIKGVNLKIIQISDYHSEENKFINNQIIKKIKEEKPDYIFITGDMVGSSDLKEDVSINFMKKLTKYSEIYYINGNHESMIEHYNGYTKELKRSNINVLNNKSVNLLQDIVLNGIDDPYMHDGLDEDTIKEEIESLNIDENRFNILLSHRPEYLDLYSDFDLVFSGHAHGGQFRFFNKGLYAPGQGLFPKLTSGKNIKNNTEMIISRGLGVFNAGFPIRINNRPELVIVNIKGSNE